MDAKNDDSLVFNSIFFDTEETETDEYDEKLLEKGKHVGIESLEWSLEFLTKNKNFLKGKPISSISLYAIYVWAGSQNLIFMKDISTCGKIRNELLNYVIHPIHELINSLRNNEFYLMALSPEDNLVLNNNISRLYIKEKDDSLKIPLITGTYFDSDFILNNIRLIYNYIILGSVDNIEKTFSSISDNLTGENINIINNSLTFSKKVADLCIQLNSVLIFHWLLLNILNNFLYSKNGPISIISFNVLIEKLSLFFPKESGYSNELYKQIIHYYESIRNIWMKVSSNNVVDSNILANYLNEYPNESEEFINLLKQIYSKYPLDDLLYLLSDFISALNIDLDANTLDNDDSHVNLPSNESESVVDSHSSLPIEADPQEPFNSIFELTGFIRASSICREFSQLLRPKEKFSENAVNNVRSILNYCIQNNKADLKYINNTEYDICRKKEDKTKTITINDGKSTEEKDAGEGEMERDCNESEIQQNEGAEMVENCTSPRKREGEKPSIIDKYLGSSRARKVGKTNISNNTSCLDEFASEVNEDKQNENSGVDSQVIRLKKIDLYSSLGKLSRKVSVKGISESSESYCSDESDSNSHKSINFENLNSVDSTSEHEQELSCKPNRRSSRLKRVVNKRQKSDPEQSNSMTKEANYCEKITSKSSLSNSRPRIKADVNEKKGSYNNSTPKKVKSNVTNNNIVISKRKYSNNKKPTMIGKTGTSVLTTNSVNNSLNQSRQYRRWNDEETNLLVNGVNKFGLGKWRFILATTKFESRDEVGLKDRWRNLVKGGHVVWDQKNKRYNLVR
ncbi:telomeric DNA binding [Cryptosporidium xiaoi]|uniref:Telomeric DNA binding n=1 Tax=Cryptosporidium xiaoi TaxID=659607 RepID=A0AAV9XYF2_9CRYT